MPANACCCYDRSPFWVLFMHIHIVSKKRDDKVKRRKDAHDDKEKGLQPLPHWNEKKR